MGTLETTNFNSGKVSGEEDSDFLCLTEVPSTLIWVNLKTEIFKNASYNVFCPH